MAGKTFSTSNASVTLTASTAQTALQLKANNVRLQLKQLQISGLDAANSSDVPVRVRITRSSASFGTGTSVSCIPRNPSESETMNTTAFANFTVEPTSPTDTQETVYVSPLAYSVLIFDPSLDVVPGNSIQVELYTTGVPTICVTALASE